MLSQYFSTSRAHSTIFEGPHSKVSQVTVQELQELPTAKIRFLSNSLPEAVPRDRSVNQSLGHTIRGTTTATGSKRKYLCKRRATPEEKVRQS